jgi:hypothetical protein
MNVNNKYVIECPQSGEGAVLKTSRSFVWGYVLGVLNFVIPQQIVFYLQQDNAMALLVGAGRQLKPDKTKNPDS